MAKAEKLDFVQALAQATEEDLNGSTLTRKALLTLLIWQRGKIRT